MAAEQAGVRARLQVPGYAWPRQRMRRKRVEELPSRAAFHLVQGTLEDLEEVWSRNVGEGAAGLYTRAIRITRTEWANEKDGGPHTV